MTSLRELTRIEITVTGARGPQALSFADIARETGTIGGVSVPADATDAEVMNLLTSAFAEVVAAAGYPVVAPVRVATIANITLSGAQTIDGVAVVAGNRVLVKNQSSAAANGVYVAAAGAWSRATDFDQTAEVVTGSYVLVLEGATQIASAWVLTTANPITVGTTAQTWLLFRDLSAYASKAGTEILTNKNFANGTDFYNGRFSFTSKASPTSPISATLDVVNDADAGIGLHVRANWTGTTADPYTNNDTLLTETFNSTLSDSVNRSWGGSISNAYHNVPVGVTDGGTRVGALGWAPSVPGQTGFVHAGTIEEMTGVMGTSGFQGAGTPTTAIINAARGVAGLIYADSVGATILTAVAGAFASDGLGVDGTVETASTIENNYAVFARARNGTLLNYSFYGEAGELANQDLIFGMSQIAAGNKLTQSSSKFAARYAGNSLEFGYPDIAGFGCNIGATDASGIPFVAFCAEADPTGDTFRTRGKKGVVLRSDFSGGLIFSRLTNANAAGQTLTESARFDPDGHLTLVETPVLATKTPASASATGIAGEVCWDTGFVYVCVAANTWKRAALTTW